MIFFFFRSSNYDSSSESDSEPATKKIKSTITVATHHSRVSDQSSNERPQFSSKEFHSLRNENYQREDSYRMQVYRNKENDHQNNRRRSSRDEQTSVNSNETKQKEKKPRKEEGADILTSRTGGAYIPPAKLKLMQAEITDKNSMEYQKISWEALKKGINGLINKVNVSNIAVIVRELFKENLIRGRGMFCRSVLQAQAASPTFTHVYAALAAIVNSKFPMIGELILKRLILQFRRSYKRNDKQVCLTSTRFIAHLVNQEVAHEVVALELLTLLLETATNDSVEVAIGFLKEAGLKLTQLSPRGVHAIFERLRNILHEGDLDMRVQYMIEVMFAIRKDNFKDHPAVLPELDLIEESDQTTHLITLDEPTDPEDKLNVFRYDENFQLTEEKYQAIRRDILDGGSSDDEDEDEEDEADEDDENETEAAESATIVDNTETNLVSLRRVIYLTIQSSLDFEECAHKLMKLEMKPGQIVELCHMIVDCCAQQRTYIKFYGLLAQRFCMLNSEYAEPFTEIFKNSYDTIHRFETNKLRNVAKLFAHLLFTDAIAWSVLSHIKLNEEDTTSSSRVFIKILFQELAEYLGLVKLNARIKDPTLQEAFDGLFPRNNPRNTRFAINFFTSIGLGGLTDDLREHLKTVPKILPAPQPTEANNDGDGSSESDSSSSSATSASSSSSSPSASCSDSSDSSGSFRRRRKSRHENRKSRSANKRHRSDRSSRSKKHEDYKSRRRH